MALTMTDARVAAWSVIFRAQNVVRTLRSAHQAGLKACTTSVFATLRLVS